MKTFFTVLCVLSAWGTCSAESLYKEDTFHSLVGDQRAHRVGDSLTILVYENSTASASADTNGQKNGGIGLAIKTPNNADKSASINLNEDFGGQGKVQRSGKLTAQLTVTVQEVAQNGDLLIAGNYTQTGAGLIEFNLAALTDFDTMDVVGNLSLNGTVQVSSLGGYNPNNDDTFTIITFDDGVADASDRTGIFSNVTWIGFDPGVSFTALYFDHSVVLSATVNPVPLPASVWLLSTGIGGAIGLARRRRRLG